MKGWLETSEPNAKSAYERCYRTKTKIMITQLCKGRVLLFPIFYLHYRLMFSLPFIIDSLFTLSHQSKTIISYTE